MLYQKLLVGSDAYFVSVCYSIREFEVHRHPEIELSYCIEGEYDIFIDNKKYHVNAGELAFVKPMASHEIKAENDFSMLTIEMGPSLLGKHFSKFVEFNFDVMINRNLDPKLNKELLKLLQDTVDIKQRQSEFLDLALKGNLFYICDFILSNFIKNKTTDAQSKDTRDIAKVETAIQIIYDEYPRQLSIEYVCNQCGYSKSNFCRVFKKITGDTFYNILNRHRIEIACMHLSESKALLDDIAFQVGFADSKSFCRVFKKIMGTSPGKYRKEVQQH